MKSNKQYCPFNGALRRLISECGARTFKLANSPEKRGHKKADRRLNKAATRLLNKESRSP